MKLKMNLQDISETIQHLENYRKVVMGCEDYEEAEKIQKSINAIKAAIGESVLEEYEKTERLVDQIFHVDPIRWIVTIKPTKGKTFQFFMRETNRKPIEGDIIVGYTPNGMWVDRIVEVREYKKEDRNLTESFPLTDENIIVTCVNVEKIKHRINTIAAYKDWKFGESVRFIDENDNERIGIISGGYNTKLRCGRFYPTITKYIQ